MHRWSIRPINEGKIEGREPRVMARGDRGPPCISSRNKLAQVGHWKDIGIKIRHYVVGKVESRFGKKVG